MYKVNMVSCTFIVLFIIFLIFIISVILYIGLKNDRKMHSAKVFVYSLVAFISIVLCIQSIITRANCFEFISIFLLTLISIVELVDNAKSIILDKNKK